MEVGDPIAEIVDNDPSLMMRLREERDAVRERQEAARARLGSLDDRIASLSGSRRAAMSAASSRTRMAKERLSGAEQALQAAEATQRPRSNLQRQQSLFEKGLSSTRALELSDLEAVRTRTEFDRARATQTAARSELLALRQDELRVGTDASALLEDVKAARATALCRDRKRHCRACADRSSSGPPSHASSESSREGNHPAAIARTWWRHGESRRSTSQRWFPIPIRGPPSCGWMAMTFRFCKRTAGAASVRGLARGSVCRLAVGGDRYVPRQSRSHRCDRQWQRKVPRAGDSR